MSGLPAIKAKTVMLGVVSKHQEPQGLTDKQRAVRDAKERVCDYIASIRTGTISDLALRPAIDQFVAQFDADALPYLVIKALKTIKRKYGEQCPSVGTIYRWHTGYLQQSHQPEKTALAPKHKGSDRKTYGWEARALAYYNKPSKPAISALARWLREEGFASALDHRVRRYLASLPSQYGPTSPGRIGKRAHKGSQGRFVRRTTENLAPGAIYQGDGHTLDLYLQHPTGNKPWRAELTLWIDVASRYVPGWHISEAESGYSTIGALRNAIAWENHLPTFLYIDNGSGYKNKMMSTEDQGIYDQLGISIVHSLPYNAKAKGHVERFFGTLERDLNKRFDSYCGHDMAQEAIHQVLKEVNQGKRQLPTQAQWEDAFRAWLVEYHQRAHKGLNGRTPEQVWQELQRDPVSEGHRYAFWTRETRKTRREEIQFANRLYAAAELAAYNNREVIVESDPDSGAYVRVLDSAGRWICDAQLVHRKPVLSDSRIADGTRKKLVNKIKRLELHAQEKRDRAGLTYTQEHLLEDEARLMPAEEPLLLDAPIDEEALLNNLLHPSDFDEAPVRQPTVNLFETD